MSIEYVFVEMFSELKPSQLGEIKKLLGQLSPDRPFKETQLCRSMMFGSLCLAIDASNQDKDQNKVVAMGLLLYRHTALYSSGLIEDVVVSKDYRGQGIGRLLMKKLVQKANSYPGGLLHIELTSSPKREAANKLYRSIGFELRKTNVYRLVLGR